MDNFDRPIFVTGCPRSGTSMVAGTLAQCGLWTGTTVAGGPENPRGFWEHVELRETVTKGLLRTMGVDPLGVTSLPTVPPTATSPGLRERVRAVLNRDGYEGERWLYKGCKLLLMWPLWVNAFPEAQWVLVLRPLNDVVSSCLKTSFMKVHSQDRAFWEAWAWDYWMRGLNFYMANPTISMVFSTRWATEPAYVERVVKELGLTYDADKVRDFIIPEALRRAE